jgi:phage gp46-like protein
MTDTSTLADLTVFVDGAQVIASHVDDPLVRAVIISLFTWRRAEPDDVLPDGGTDRRGWCGDSLATVAGDKIGCRWWLLARAPLTLKTINAARDYAIEAVKWLIDDKVCRRIEVQSERFGMDGLAVGIKIYRNDGSAVALKFSSVWQAING